MTQGAGSTPASPASTTSTTTTQTGAANTPTTAVKPKHGGITSDALGNQTPFTGKGRKCVNPDGTTGIAPVSVWCNRKTDTKFQTQFDNKMEEGIGAIYGGPKGGDDDVNLDDWRELLAEKLKKMGLDGVFRIEVDGTERYIVEDPALFNYDITKEYYDAMVQADQYDQYDRENLMFAYEYIINSLDASIIKRLKKYKETKENGLLLFAAFMQIEEPATDAAARRYVSKFEAVKLSDYPKEDISKMGDDIKDHLEKVEQMKPDLVPTDAVTQLVDKLGQCSVSAFTTKLYQKFPATEKEESGQLELKNGQLVLVKTSPHTWRDVLQWTDAEYERLKAGGKWTPEQQAGMPLKDETAELRGMLASTANQVNQLRNQFQQQRRQGNDGGTRGSGGQSNSGGGATGGTNGPSPSRGQVTTGCVICSEEGHFAKDCQKGTVPKYLPPEGKGPTTVTTSSGTYSTCRKFKRWYKKGKKAWHTTETHRSKAERPDTNAGRAQMVVEQSTESVTGDAESVSGHPDDALTFDD